MKNNVHNNIHFIKVRSTNKNIIKTFYRDRKQLRSCSKITFNVFKKKYDFVLLILVKRSKLKEKNIFFVNKQV